MNLIERDKIIKVLQAEAEFIETERDKLKAEGRDTTDNMLHDLIALYRVISYLARQGIGILRS